MSYTPTIGLEVHAELKTKTKMFCNSKNDPEEDKPNVNICPVCMGHPGTLPVINKEAVKHVLKMGTAVGGTCADFTEFDRKNYFYPDLPKGYQISQYKYPLVSGGTLEDVTLTRIHLEEDTARSIHERGNYSLLDFNRAGVPLMELVTEPEIYSALQAGRFARELQRLLRYLHASDANMEKGQMRVEANVSISKDDKRGVKVEVKNLNSFRAVERAIAYEIDRQTKLLERGEAVAQETRGWDERRQKTISQRIKEEAHDYRYFPDPDLPKLYVSEIPEFQKGELEKNLPELPWQRRKRLVTDFGLTDEAADIFVNNLELGEFFEAVVKQLDDDKELVRRASNYITSDLLGLMGHSSDIKISPQDFATIITMVAEGALSSRSAKSTLELMYKDEIPGTPEEIAEKHGLLQKSDEGELQNVAKNVIAQNPAVATEYKNGKEQALQFLVGQGMKETGGSADPQKLAEMLKKAIK